jgi:hypothetical protein
MANFTENGTYTLPFNGDTGATVDPGLTDVTFVLSTAVPTAFVISSNTGSHVSVDASSDTATTVLSLDTKGGTILLESGLGAGQLTVIVAIDGGGISQLPGNLLNSITGGSILFGSGGGTEVVGTAGTTNRARKYVTVGQAA